MTGMQDPPGSPAEAARRDGTVLAHLLIVADVQRSVRFCRDVLGATVVREGEPSILRLCHGWLILNVGGGPTPDKPEVTMTPPASLASVTSALNIRVADLAAVYQACLTGQAGQA